MIITEEYEAINQALLFAMANMHTTVICKVTAVNEKTINCQPVINRVVNGESKPLPAFEEVPPVFMHGGGSSETWPIKSGDYCLVLISERCYDAWYFGNDNVSPLDMRMHDYSDGFALVGIHNNAGALTIPDVITRIGDMFARGDWTLKGSLTQTGDQDVTGEIEASVKVAAPILQGVIQGVNGGPATSDQTFTATELHAQNGVSGTFVSGTTLTFVDGILVGAS